MITLSIAMGSAAIFFIGLWFGYQIGFSDGMTQQAIEGIRILRGEK